MGFNYLLYLCLHHHQGGQSDSGMGLSSDNMNTLKRLESLAGRPLSIMALAYVHYTTQHHTTWPPSDKSTHTNTHWKKLHNNLLGHPPVVVECRHYNCHTTHTSLFCFKNTLVFSFTWRNHVCETVTQRGIGKARSYKSGVSASLDVWLF